MPLTASGQVGGMDNGAGRQGFVRIMAAIEGLILAGVLYLVSSVRSQELSMAEIKASTAGFQQAMATIPPLAIRVAQTERDVAANAARIAENTEDIKDLRKGREAVDARDTKWR